MKPTCLLCTSENIDVSGEFATHDLSYLYKKLLNMSISSDFNDIQMIKFYHCHDCDLRFFHPAVVGTEYFYNEMQNFDWYYLADKPEYDFASHYINKRDRVLEIGCGIGAFHKKINYEAYVGLELNNKARLIAKEKGLNVITETVEIHFDKTGQTYNVVCAFQVLEHVKNVSSFLISANKCLAPGGLLIISVPSEDSFLSSITNDILNFPPHHITRWSDISLKSIADILGLELIALQHEGLAEIHKQWYASEVVLKALNKLFNRQVSILDTSLFGRALGLSASLLGRFYSLGLEEDSMCPDGHSVTAVFRKPSEK